MERTTFTCPECADDVMPIALPYQSDSETSDIDGWQYVCPVCHYAFGEVDPDQSSTWDV